MTAETIPFRTSKAILINYMETKIGQKRRAKLKFNITTITRGHRTQQEHPLSHPAQSH